LWMRLYKDKFVDSSQKRPILHLLVGLPCSGKSTYAQGMQAEFPSVILNADSWELALFGSIFPSERHEKVHDQLEKLLWGLGQDILRHGTSVVLDYGFWAREERDYYRQTAGNMGLGFMIHYLDTPLEVIRERVTSRSAKESEFNISYEDILGWSRIFEPPLPGDQDTRIIKSG